MGWKYWLNSVYYDLTCAIYHYFCISVSFLVFIQVSVVIMVVYSEHLLCFDICDTCILKNLWDGEGVNENIYIFYIYIKLFCLFRVDIFIISSVQHFFRVYKLRLFRVNCDIFITFRVHQAQIKKVTLNRNKKWVLGCPEGWNMCTRLC